jgi:hypothetical protein
MWKGGAYRATSFDDKSGHGALVEYDGRGAMRLVGVTGQAFEEIVTTRRAVGGGVFLATSELVGNRSGILTWRWTVDRPGLHREETWKIDPHGKGTWQQVDVRPGRSTTYHSTGPGRYRGVVTTPGGTALWTSEWKSDGRGGMVGSYTDPQGSPAGTVSFPGREQRDDGDKVSWTGPASEGSVETGSGENSGSVKAVIKTEGGVTTYTWDEGEGHSVQTGDGPGITWLKITVPGKEKEGDSRWVEMGTETVPPSAGSPGGSSADYTVNGVSHADGSSSFSRVSNDPTTGDKETTFGGTDVDGNRSYSSSIEHADGSVTLVTRTVDKNGDGTEHVTTVDAQGNTTKDQTFDVKGGSTVPSGGGSDPSGGSSGDNSGSGPSGGYSGDNSGSGGSGNDHPTGSGASPDSGSGDSGTDPNSPSEPDSPDSPDSGGGESGMGSDDGTDDRAPGVPWGKIGHKGGDSLDDLFSGIRGGGTGGDDGEEGGAAERNEQWLRQLVGEIHDAGTGGGGDGADETGWGSGEGPRGIPLISSAYTPPPPSSNETGWGDLNNPRALTALVAAFANAAAGLAGSRNLIGVLRS